MKKLNPKKAFFLNIYTATIVIFMVWMIFFDSTSWLVINNLNKEISKHEQQLIFYQAELKKNNAHYKKLTQNKDEKEKFARENYFMKKSNEEIFILVTDSTETTKQKHLK
ncbi:MAG: septum formation initiator family protein [Flavobacteriaceae bacterium]|nr:septum formation initiator family protein [Flavobacteriaceae bacterium]